MNEFDKYTNLTLEETLSDFSGDVIIHLGAFSGYIDIAPASEMATEEHMNELYQGFINIKMNTMTSLKIRMQNVNTVLPVKEQNLKNLKENSIRRIMSNLLYIAKSKGSVPEDATVDQMLESLPESSISEDLWDSMRTSTEKSKIKQTENEIKNLKNSLKSAEKEYSRNEDYVKNVVPLQKRKVKKVYKLVQENCIAIIIEGTEPGPYWFYQERLDAIERAKEKEKELLLQQQEEELVKQEEKAASKSKKRRYRVKGKLSAIQSKQAENPSQEERGKSSETEEKNSADV